MKRQKSVGRLATAIATAAALAVCCGPAQAQPVDRDNWIGTWSASPQPLWKPGQYDPVGIPRTLHGETIRQIARVSLGGERVRIVLSNEYGNRPLTIGSVHIALSRGRSAIAPDSDRALTFGGQNSVTISPGAPVISDPVDLIVPALASVAVSLYVPGIAAATTWHNEAIQTAYLARGDVVSRAALARAKTFRSRIFLTEIQVDAPPDTRAVVAFGDSITDGNTSTHDADHRWPDFLAARLQEAGMPIAVLNQGISGARVLRNGIGDNAMARFGRDVLGHPRVDTMILLLGINDIGWPGTMLVPKTELAPSAEEIIAGYRQLIARAHAHGIRILGATLTPFEDTFRGDPLSRFYNAAKELKRRAVNQWIRTSGAFDGVIDFDAAIRDPANPKHMRADCDSGDHLHPSDAGYQAMANAIDLELLTGKQR